MGDTWAWNEANLAITNARRAKRSTDDEALRLIAKAVEELALAIQHVSRKVD